jgi:hypothetical protein
MKPRATISNGRKVYSCPICHQILGVETNHKSFAVSRTMEAHIAGCVRDPVERQVTEMLGRIADKRYYPPPYRCQPYSSTVILVTCSNRERLIAYLAHNLFEDVKHAEG